MPVQSASLPATGRGKLPLLLLLCAVQFLSAAGSSIINVALQPVRRDLGFPAQGLQRVVPGYLVTYGGLLPGGRAGRGDQSTPRGVSAGALNAPGWQRHASEPLAVVL